MQRTFGIVPKIPSNMLLQSLLCWFDADNLSKFAHACHDYYRAPPRVET